MLTAILAIAFLAVLFGLLLGYSAIRFKVEGDPLAERIDALLPQTQCGQCGYPGCKPYAEAIAKGEAPINKCVPRRHDDGHSALADLLGRDPEPVSGAGPEKPKAIAVINEPVSSAAPSAFRPARSMPSWVPPRQLHVIHRQRVHRL